jgi:hypothetical protein
MTQNTNNPSKPQTGTPVNPQTKDGNRKETDPNSPVANKGSQKNSDNNNSQRADSSNQQYSSGGQNDKTTSSNSGKTDKNTQYNDPREKAEDEKDEQTPGKIKTDKPGWNERKPENPASKK